MEAASTSEKLVNFCQTTWHYNPENRHLHTRRDKSEVIHKDENKVTRQLKELIRTELDISQPSAAVISIWLPLL
jgi:hypothetical protein